MNQNPSISATTAIAPVTIGKYRIAACPRPLDGGRFAAQVSISSGHGSASTDRVMQYTQDFPTFDAAAEYALSQGIAWAKNAAGLQQTLTH